MIDLAKEEVQMHFPAIKTSRTPDKQAEKVIEEVREFLEMLASGNASRSDEEAVDVLQCAETLIRVHFRDRMDEFERVKREVFVKNDFRGYYTKGCH